MQTYKIKWWVRDEFLPTDMRGESDPDLVWDVEAEDINEALATIDPQLYATGRLDVVDVEDIVME